VGSGDGTGDAELLEDVAGVYGVALVCPGEGSGVAGVCGGGEGGDRGGEVSHSVGDVWGI